MKSPAGWQGIGLDETSTAELHDSATHHVDISIAGCAGIGKPTANLLFVDDTPLLDLFGRIVLSDTDDRSSAQHERGRAARFEQAKDRDWAEELWSEHH